MLDYILDFYINRIYGPAYIVTEMLFLLCVVVISNRIEPTAKGMGRVILHFWGLWLAHLTVCCVWYYGANSLGNGGPHNNPNMYVMPMMLTAYMVLLSRYKWTTRLVVAVTFYASFGVLLGLTEAIGYVLRVDYGIDGMTTWSMILALIGITAYLYVFNFNDCVFIPSYGILLECGFTALMYFVQDLSRTLERPTRILLIGCLLLMELMAYYMFYAISEQYSDKVTRQVLRDRKAGARDMLLVSKAGYDNIHVVLHDVKNQFATLKALLHSGKYPEAIKFLDEFELFASPVIEAVDCGNVVVDSALAVGRAKAREKGLRLHTRVAVPPALPILDTELVSIISNLVDNAIEACVREKHEGGVITVDLRYQRDYLLLRVENPVSDDLSPEQRLKLESGKSGTRHGWGTRIVRSIAEKYDGMVKYSVKDGKFYADVMLAVPSGEGEDQRGKNQHCCAG